MNNVNNVYKFQKKKDEMAQLRRTHNHKANLFVASTLIAVLSGTVTLSSIKASIPIWFYILVVFAFVVWVITLLDLLDEKLPVFTLRYHYIVFAGTLVLMLLATASYFGFVLI